MKKLFKYFGLILSVAVLGAVNSCDILEPTEQEAEVGLAIKVFSPTKVVAGTPMTINGSGFTDVKEIVFPDQVSVTAFKIVTDNMIRVEAPKGISAEGGKIIVRTDAGDAESAMSLVVGNPKVTGYDRQEGETITGGEMLTIYGQDLEFVTGFEILDEDGNPKLVKDSEFYRKGTDKVVVIIPRKVFEGTYACKIYFANGVVVTTPEFVFEQPSDGGHWETVQEVIWENDGSKGTISWGGDYRFSNETNKTGEEIYAIPDDIWEKMKAGTFYIEASADADWYNLRITTGWWSTTYTGADIGKGSESIVVSEDGSTFTLGITLSDDAAIMEVVDVQHLLFTGEGYTPLKLYFEEEVWVGGEGHLEIVKTSVWKNSGSEAVSWNGVYRFALEGHDGNNECIAEIPQDIWDKLLTETFYLDVEATDPQVRVTTGWWDPTWAVGDIQPGNELIKDNEDGTWTVTINLSGDPTFVEALVDRHLLFTGDRYVPLEIYFQEEVWVGGGGGPKQVVFWEGDGATPVSWNGVYRFGLEGTDTNPAGKECIAEIPQDAWDKLKSGIFYMDAAINNADWYNVRITTGWWDPNWAGGDIGKGSESMVENEDGTFTLTIDITGDAAFVEAIDQRHLLFTGEGYTPLKLYFVE